MGTRPGSCRRLLGDSLFQVEFESFDRTVRSTSKPVVFLIDYILNSLYLVGDLENQFEALFLKFKKGRLALSIFETILN